MKISLFIQKSDYLRKENWNTQQVCFSKQVWKVANPEENLDLFLIKQVKGENFLLKVSHIQLNYAFLLFWRIFGEIHWKLLFLVKKATISERSSEILRKIIFLNMFEKEKIQRKIWI